MPRGIELDNITEIFLSGALQDLENIVIQFMFVKPFGERSGEVKPGP